MGCVYRATSKTSGKSYIGMTTQTLHRRRGQHICKSPLLYTSIFHRAIVKYGKDDFTWEELFVHTDKDVLFQKEKEFIVLHNTHTPNGYNITSGGAGASDIEFSPERRELKVRCPPKTSISVYCVELDKSFVSQRLAERETGVTSENIKRQVEGLTSLHRKYHFSYDTPECITQIKADLANGKLLYKPFVSEESRKRRSEARKGIPYTEERLHILAVAKAERNAARIPRKHTRNWLKGAAHPHASGIINLDDGNVFCTINEAVAFYHLRFDASSNIGKCCRGLKLSAYGYRWAYKSA